MAVLKKAFKFWGLANLFTAGAWAWLVVLAFVTITNDKNTFMEELGIVEWFFIGMSILLLVVSGPGCFLLLARDGWRWGWVIGISAHLMTWLIFLALYSVPVRRKSPLWFIKYAVITLVWELGLGAVLLYIVLGIMLLSGGGLD